MYDVTSGREQALQKNGVTKKGLGKFREEENLCRVSENLFAGRVPS